MSGWQIYEPFLPNWYAVAPFANGARSGPSGIQSDKTPPGREDRERREGLREPYCLDAFWLGYVVLLRCERGKGVMHT